MSITYGKLEQGFKATAKQEQTLYNTFSPAQLEEFRLNYFTKDGASRGSGTIASFNVIRAKVQNSVGTGAVEGRVIKDNVKMVSEDDKPQWMKGVSLYRIFEHQNTLGLFFAFASLRLVPESILFWTAVESLQNSGWKANRVLGICSSSESEEELRSRAMDIWRDFLSGDATYEVCLPHKMLSDIEKSIKAGAFHKDLFTNAQAHVFRDMEKGLFREFLSTLNSKGLELISAELNKISAPGLASATALSMSAKKKSMPKIQFEEETKQ